MDSEKVEAGQKKWKKMVEKYEIDYRETVFLCLTPDCEKILSSTEKFCPQCGQPTKDNLLRIEPQSQSIVISVTYHWCPGCKKEVANNKDKYCSKCGNEIQIKHREESSPLK